MTTPQISQFLSWLSDPTPIRLGGVPDGYEARILAEALARIAEKGEQRDIVFVARDHQKAGDLEAAFSFFAPWADTLNIPAWDCLPYDRVSPSNDVLAKRISALSELARNETAGTG